MTVQNCFKQRLYCQDNTDSLNRKRQSSATLIHSSRRYGWNCYALKPFIICGPEKQAAFYYRYVRNSELSCCFLSCAGLMPVYKCIVIVFTQAESSLQIICRFDFMVALVFYYYFTRVLCHSCDLSVQLCMYENTATLKEYRPENMILQSSFRYDLRNIYSNLISLRYHLQLQKHILFSVHDWFSREEVVWKSLK